MQLSKSHTGHWKYGWYLWELITEMDLSIDELANVQEKNGYPVNPYGFYEPKKYQRKYRNGKTEFKYIWKCATSSD